MQFVVSSNDNTQCLEGRDGDEVGLELEAGAGLVHSKPRTLIGCFLE